MVKASSQIEKELGSLQQRTEDMAIALDPLYDGYLNALAEASKQQLMSAAYHLCTQAYPDKFLTLSWKERNELQKALQVLAAQIQPQLQEQRSRAKKMSRRPQRSSGLDFLHRLLESRSSSAIVHTSGDSSDDLLEKLSEVAQLDQRSDNLDRKSGRRQSDYASSIDESEVIEDWEEDIPTAEGDDESDSTLSESLFMHSSQPEDDAFTAVDLEDMDFSDSKRSELGENLPVEDLNEELDEEELDFEMEVPAAEQRLTISDEEDLLTALKGLARHSAVEDSTGDDEQPLAPVHLFRQQMLMEKGIRDVFKTISSEVNELLQKAKVMPRFPKALMAAAIDPQGIGEPVNAVPNVVKVSVRVMHGEVDVKSDEARDGERESPPGPRSDKRQRRSQSNQARSTPSRSMPSRPTPSRPKSGRAASPRHLVPRDMVEIDTLPELAVINLQLSEVAFTDPTVSAWWTRLRKELSTLKRLGNRYTKAQRSLETAQAEDAWRSSWIAQDRD